MVVRVAIGILLMFVGCSAHPTAKTPSDPFVSAQEIPSIGATWESSCSRNDLVTGATIRLGSVCTSAPLLLPQGHYNLQLRFPKALDVHTLGLSVAASYTDSSGIRRTLSGLVAGKRLSEYVFRPLTFTHGALTKEVMLLPPDYPLDGGWFPATTKGIVFTVTSKQPVEIDSLSATYSKWNRPLKERLTSTSTLPLPPQTFSPIAVNLQGLSTTQLAELHAARKVWQPLGPVTVIVQIDPRDVIDSDISSDTRAVLTFLREWSDQNRFISFGISVNPYLNDWHIGNVTRFYDGSTLRSVKKIVDSALKEGADVVLLRADDFAPKVDSGTFDYGLAATEDKKRYKSLGVAHASFITELQAALTSEGKSLPIAFVPSWYTTAFVRGSPKRGTAYLQELGALLPKDVPLVWTGPAVRSLWIDDVSVKEFDHLTDHHPRFLWDNTPYARAHRDFWLKNPDRVTSCSLFEPYDISLTTASLVQSTNFPAILVNTGLNPINRIQLETTQWYLTTPHTYQPEQAIQSILNYHYGAATTATLLSFDHHFWLAYQAMLTNNTPQLDAEKHFLHLLLDELYRNQSPKTVELRVQLEQIIKTGLSKDSDG